MLSYLVFYHLERFELGPQGIGGITSFHHATSLPKFKRPEMSSSWQQKITIIEKASAKLGLMFNTSKRERIMAQIKINDRMEAETETFSFKLCNTTDNG